MCALLEARIVEEPADPVRASCPTCRYSLAGLPPSGRCPECGDHYDPPPPTRRVERLALRPGVLGFWLIALATAIAFEVTGVGRWLFAQGVIQSYIDDGYSVEVATNAAFKRELRGGGAEIGQVVGGWWCGVSPLLGLMERGWHRYAILFGVGGLVLVLIYLCGPRA